MSHGHEQTVEQNVYMNEHEIWRVARNGHVYIGFTLTIAIGRR